MRRTSNNEKNVSSFLAFASFSKCGQGAVRRGLKPPLTEKKEGNFAATNEDDSFSCFDCSWRFSRRMSSYSSTSFRWYVRRFCRYNLIVIHAVMGNYDNCQHDTQRRRERGRVTWPAKFVFGQVWPDCFGDENVQQSFAFFAEISLDADVNISWALIAARIKMFDLKTIISYRFYVKIPLYLRSRQTLIVFMSKTF